MGVVDDSIPLSRDCGLGAGFLLILCGLQRPSGPEHLEPIADCAHQPPFTADILLAAPFLDLSEDRFNDCLAHLVDRSSGLGLQLVPHLLPWSSTSRRLAGGRFCRIAVLITTRRDV